MPRTSDPKIPVSTGVSAELFVKLEDFARENKIMRGEKVNLSGLLLMAAASYVGYELPAKELAQVSEQTAEEKKAAAREAEKARREEARKRVEAIRAKAHAAPTATHAVK